VSQPEPAKANNYLEEHIQCLQRSLKHWRGSGFKENGDTAFLARELYHAPFALLSHGNQDDPIINYANRTAQQLFELDWHAFIKLSSRLSAEPVARAERETLLKRVSENGFISDYSGVRISSTGQRFMIHQASVWNLLDQHGKACGQAAMFSNWRNLDTVR